MLRERVLGRLRHRLYDEPPADGTGAGGGGGTPTFVPTEDFKQFQSVVLDQFRELGEGLRAIRASAVASGARVDPVNAEPEVVSEQQYLEAVQAGDVETMTKYKRRQQFETLRAIAPSLNLGLDSLSTIVATSAEATLPHYKRYKKEIDDYVKGMTPEMRMNPIAYQIAHDTVVGRNVHTIVKEAVETALRSAADVGNPNGGGGSGSRSGGGGGGPAVPSVAELLGDQAHAALLSKGIDADTWSRRLGYKGWAEYADEIKKQREEA